MIHLMMAAIAVATTPVPLEPSGKWVVDYQKDMCVVSRPFGPATSNTIFAIKPSIAMTEGGATLFVLAAKRGGSDVRRGEATLTLQPSGEQHKVRYVSWIPKGGLLRGYEFEAGPTIMAGVASATGIALSVGKDSFAFSTGKIEPVISALTACNDDLFRTWGVDPMAKALTAKGVQQTSWFPADSYPTSAARRGAQGRSVVVLTVGPNGRPTACRVAVKVDPDLDKTTCQLAMNNGRYEVSPEKSDRYSILSVRWIMGGF